MATCLSVIFQNIIVKLVINYYPLIILLWKFMEIDQNDLVLLFMKVEYYFEKNFHQKYFYILDSSSIDDEIYS